MLQMAINEVKEYGRMEKVQLWAIAFVVAVDLLYISH